METNKIKDIKIIYNSNNMIFNNSYKINNIKIMKDIISRALKETSIYITNRSEQSLLNEWISHNILYKLHLFRNHTKNCSFENKISRRKEIIYEIISFPKKILYKIKNKISFLKIEILLKKSIKRRNNGK